MYVIRTELAAVLLLVRQAVLQQDLQKILQVAVPVVCAIIYMPQLPAAALALAIPFAFLFGTILAAHVSVLCGSVARALNPVTIIQLVIKAVAAQHLVAITHVAVPCSSVLEVFGNQATEVLAALIQVRQMVLNLNGDGKATASIRLVFVAKVK
jgi:hypothetical protein